jgi:hypothetical protein
MTATLAGILYDEPVETAQPAKQSKPGGNRRNARFAGGPTTDIKEWLAENGPRDYAELTDLRKALYPNVCRTRRKNASAGIGFGDTNQQIGNAREVETLWPAGDQRRTNQLFRRPVDLKFDRRTTGVSFRTPKNARIPEVRGRQRAAPNRQRVGRN